MSFLTFTVFFTEQKRRLLRWARIRDDVDLGTGHGGFRACLDLLERFHHRRWIGRSVGRWYNLRLRRHFLASRSPRRRLLDPPRTHVIISQFSWDETRPDSPAAPN